MSNVIINENKLIEVSSTNGRVIVTGREVIQEEIYDRVSSDKATFRKFKAESFLSTGVSVTNSMVEQDLIDIANGVEGALAKLLQDIGGIANLSSYKQDGKNLIELTIDQQLPAAARALIDAGFDINAKSINGISILTLLCQQTYNPLISRVLREAWIPVAKMLVEKGADISSSNANDSPLIEAVDCAGRETGSAEGSIYYELLSAMLARGANINMIVYVKNGKSIVEIRSPLFTAARNHNPVLAQYLLDHGADKNQVINTGTDYNTPLLLATYYATSPDLSDSIHKAWQAVYEVLKNAP